VAGIEAHYIDTFKGNLNFMLSTKKSKLRGAVMETDLKGKGAAYDDFGETEMEEKTGRFAPTPLTPLEHYRRWIYSKPFDKALPVDWADLVKVLVDPKGPYTQKIGAAINRKIDKLIIDSFEADSKAGETAGETKTFDTGMIVDVQVRDVGVSAADFGLNVPKLLAAGELLDDAENEEGEERYCLVPPRQITSLLKSTKVGSHDYNEVRALQEGKISKFAGFNFIMLPKKYLKLDSNGDDKVYYWTKSGVLFAKAKEPMVKADERADLSYTWQVYGAFEAGATRMNEQKVGYIECDPTAGPGA
jgi:hypothetical protein